MTLYKVVEILEASVLEEGNMDNEIMSACGADLMSDVLAFSKENGILLTGLVNLQVVRTAEMMDMRGICFVRGKKPSDEILELSKEKGLTIMTTAHPLYVACGKLYSGGLVGGATDEN